MHVVPPHEPLAAPPLRPKAVVADLISPTLFMGFDYLAGD
jgi:hypothetical protein